MRLSGALEQQARNAARQGRSGVDEASTTRWDMTVVTAVLLLGRLCETPSFRSMLGIAPTRTAVDGLGLAGVFKQTRLGEQVLRCSCPAILRRIRGAKCVEDQTAQGSLRLQITHLTISHQ